MDSTASPLPQRSLLRTRGFIPLVLMMFLNAFIDLGHKITIQNTLFKLYDGSEQIILTAIINAFILLPYILFFRPAGKTADQHSKTRVLRFTSLAALLIMLAITLCYWMGWFWAAFLLTLALAVQSAWYGPAKLGFLKELVSNEQLKKANGIAQSLLMIAILSGILVFSMLFEMYFTDALQQPEQVIKAMTPLAALLVLVACLEYCLSWLLPLIRKTPAPVNIPQKTSDLLTSPVLLPVIIGLAVFWSVGQMLLAVYPAFAKETLGITNAMLIQGVLALMAIGIMLGSLLDSLLSRQFIELKLLPVSGFIVIIAGLLLPLTHSILLAALLFLMMGIAGGILVVPLNALVQFCTAPDKLGITIAQTNLIQNIAMLGCLVLTALFSALNIPAWQLLFLIALISATGLAAMLYQMPQTLAALSNRHTPQVEGFNRLRGYGVVAFIVHDDSPAIRKALRHSYPRQLSNGLPEQWSAHSAVILTENELANARLPDDAALFSVHATLSGTQCQLRFDQISKEEMAENV